MKTFTEGHINGAIAEVTEVLGQMFDGAAQVGSTYINGLSQGEDIDIVVLAKLPPNMAGGTLTNAGYTQTSDDSYDDDEFFTYRKGDVNIMLTDSRDFFVRFQDAAEVCKYVNALLFKNHGVGLSKVHRVAIHRILMNEEDCKQAFDEADERFG